MKKQYANLRKHVGSSSVVLPVDFGIMIVYFIR